jgi:hypothetical protein
MFTWKIEGLYVIPQEAGHTDVVVKVMWKCIASDDGTYATYWGSCYGQMMFGIGDSFTEFQNLTEDEILGWCFAAGVDKTQIETMLNSGLNNRPSVPIENKPLPWI